MLVAVQIRRCRLVKIVPFITRSQLLTNGVPDKPSYSLLSFITGKTVLSMLGP